MNMEELKKEIEGEEKVIIHTQVLYDLMKQIEKQQKEIEELKEKYNEKDVECRHLMEFIKSSSNVEYLVKESK